MKKILLAFACTVALAVSAFAQNEDNQFLIKFTPTTDVQKEIDAANAFLAALPSTATLDDEYETTPDGLVFEIKGDDPNALKALVETYFPADPNVLAVSYIPSDDTEDDSAEDLNDMKESTGDTNSGTDVVGMVKIAKAAPKGGTKVLLATTNSKVATVPAYVIIPAGKTSAHFKIHTAAKVSKTTIVRIGSHLNGKTLAMSLRVRKH